MMKLISAFFSITFFFLQALFYYATGMDLDPPAQYSKAKIYRQGKGVVDIDGLNGQWPEGYSLQKEGGYDIKRFPSKDHPSFKPMYDHNDKVHATWAPDNFTSLSVFKEGDYLPKNFKLIVHGLELLYVKYPRKYTDSGKYSPEQKLNVEESLHYQESFDHFVHDVLNLKAPLDVAFIRYYPYFFHKKTVIWASLIFENYTATSENIGFILTVPSINYLSGGGEPMMIIPTGSLLRDRYFYPPYLQFSEIKSIGELDACNCYRDHLLPRLEDTLSPKPSPREEGHAKYIRLFCDNGFTPEKAEEKYQSLMKSRHGDNFPFAPQVNHIAINPAVPLAESRSSSTPKITGVFLRVAEKELPDFLKKPYVSELISTAEAFDLPIVLIKDDNTH